jgi:hypothetical protein
MPSESTTRWTISISKDTDLSLRTFLAGRGTKKGDISKFVEEAVRWRILDETINEARDKFSDLNTDELQALIDDASVDARLKGK